MCLCACVKTDCLARCAKGIAARGQILASLHSGSYSPLLLPGTLLHQLSSFPVSPQFLCGFFLFNTCIDVIFPLLKIRIKIKEEK